MQGHLASLTNVICLNKNVICLDKNANNNFKYMCKIKIDIYYNKNNTYVLFNGINFQTKAKFLGKIDEITLSKNRKTENPKDKKDCI